MSRIRRYEKIHPYVELIALIDLVQPYPIHTWLMAGRKRKDTKNERFLQVSTHSNFGTDSLRLSLSFQEEDISAVLLRYIHKKCTYANVQTIIIKV